jgi:RNA polymerase sigma-70 factor (ECF subfamily)
VALDRQEAAGSRQERFEALIHQHRGIVFKVASIYCRDVEEQRDLAQEIRAQAWRAFPRYDEGRSFATWMYRIALNVAISHRRSVEYRRRHVADMDADVLESVPDPAGHDPDDRVRELYRVIDRLDDLKVAWAHLEDRVEKTESLVRREYTARRLNESRRAFRGLTWGQAAQVLAWIGVAAIVAPFG